MSWRDVEQWSDSVRTEELAHECINRKVAQGMTRAEAARKCRAEMAEG